MFNLKCKKHTMDTDELSTETYKGIIIEAENFNHDLTLQFGLMASSCENEKDYLDQARILIKEIKKLNKAGLSNMFFGMPPDKNKLHFTLQKILTNILEIEKTPENQRHYDF